MTKDSYRILEPYGRDLAPEARWLESFSDTDQVWVTWLLVGGEKIESAGPLSAEERETLAELLRNAERRHSGSDTVALIGRDQPSRLLYLDQIAELQLLVTA
jgi:hypothetical protein